MQLAAAEAELVKAKRNQESVMQEWGVAVVKRKQAGARDKGAARAEDEIRERREQGEDLEAGALGEAEDGECQRIRRRHAEAAAVEIVALREQAKREAAQARAGVERAVARRKRAAAAMVALLS